MLLLDMLFEGHVDDLPSSAELLRLLDLPERLPFVVVVAEMPSAGEEVLPRIEQALRHTGRHSAWRVTRHRKVGIVAIGPIGESLTVLRDLLIGRATSRVGLSPSYVGLVDTARHVSLADLALRSSPPGSKNVVLFEEQPVGALVARSPELGERVASLILGKVLALETDDRDVLLATLAAWFESGGSVAQVAERLFCHRNTVRNRMQRLELLTGRSLTDPIGSAELYIAVTAARLVLALDF